MCHPLAPFLLVAPVARSACRQVSELCECCACVCSLGMRLRALDARAAVECVAGVMASAIELEIQECRVKKARLDVEEEEINVRRMELALQRSKVEEQTEALQRSKIEEQAEALVSSPTETSSTASNLDALLWAIQSASPLRQAPQILMPAPEYPVGQRACVYWPAMRQSYAGTITEARADGAVFVEYDDGDAKWEDSWEPLRPGRCQRTSGCPKFAGHVGRCRGSKITKERPLEEPLFKVVLKLKQPCKRVPKSRARLGDGDGWGVCVDHKWSSA